MTAADSFKHRLECWLLQHANAGRLPWANDGPGTRLHEFVQDVIGVRVEGSVDDGWVNLRSDHTSTAPGDCCALILPTALMSLVGRDPGRPADWNGTPADLLAFLQGALGDGFGCWSPDSALLQEALGNVVGCCRPVAALPDRVYGAPWLFDAPWQRGVIVSLRELSSIAYAGTLGGARRARELGCVLQQRVESTEPTRSSELDPRGNSRHGSDGAKRDAAARAFATLVTSCAARPTHRGGK